jgi:hypothetical protein
MNIAAIEATTITRIRDAVTNGTYPDAVQALLDFQVEHYTQRLKEETDPGARSFLRREIFRLKQDQEVEA